MSSRSVQLYYRKAVSEEVLQAEQTRIEAERTQAHRWVEAATHEAEDVLQALDEALTIIGRCHETYLAASPMLRRLLNQVIFEKLLIRTDGIEGKPQPVFGHIARLGRGCQNPAQARRPRNGQGPRLLGGLGSNVDQMVRQVGIQGNGQEQVEALVRLLLEPVGRRQRQKVIALLDT